MNSIKKWYTYQKERFPILIYGIYILGIVVSSYCISIFIKKLNEPLYNKTGLTIMIPMFIVAFLQFLMVRIIDEFKDYEDDKKYRPYRPVPRGLVKLSELKIVFVICALVQFIFSIIYKNIIPLFVVWIFFFIMSKSYFIKKFIDKHLLFEVALDEILMPLLVIYLISFIDINILSMSYYIYVFLFMTYIVSWIIEIARKVRSKDEEEKGVKTYTAILGIKNTIWLLFILETILATLQLIILGKPYILLAIMLYVTVNIINIMFMLKQNKLFSKLTELSANIYITIIYFSMLLLI